MTSITVRNQRSYDIGQSVSQCTRHQCSIFDIGLP